MDRASQALRRIAEQLQDSPTDQKVTMLRFSQATKAITAGETAADLNAVTVDSEFTETMEEAKRRFDVTDLAVSPLPALEMLEQLMSNAVEDQRVAYVLSDFRANEWKQTAEIKEALRGFRENGSDVHLIRCVDDQHPNLAIVDVLPGQGTLAAGVPLFVNVKVRNFGPHAAQQVAVRMSAKSYPEAD